MLACDAAFRERRNAIDLMIVMNALHMKDHPNFSALLEHLDLARAHKVEVGARVRFVDCMSRNRVDAVVAHQWEWAQNYAYYDALHGGYPLIHNSPILHEAGVGLHYEGFEAVQAGRVLLHARTQGREWWQDYRSRAASWLATLDPLHPANIRVYSDRIAALLKDRLGCA